MLKWSLAFTKLGNKSSCLKLPRGCSITCLWASSFWWNRLIPSVAGWPFRAGALAATELIRSCLAALSGISLTWVMAHDGGVLWAQMTWWKFSLQPLSEINTQYVFEAGGQSDLVPFLFSYRKRQREGGGSYQEIHDWPSSLCILSYCLIRLPTFW